MKKVVLIMVLLIPFYNCVDAQSVAVANQSCSVILFNDKWLINSYDPGERAVLDLSAEGVISVGETGDISLKSFKKEKLEFSIAIRKKTGKLEVLFANFKSVKAQDVLKKCEEGDKIVVLLKDSQHYFLPHYEIEVRDGC
jgi:hypothetical protein